MPVPTSALALFRAPVAGSGLVVVEDQQLDVESLKSFLRTIDNDISLEPFQ